MTSTYNTISKTIEHKGSVIHYYVSGNENGETIVFVHPAFGDHQCFDKQIAYFAPTHRVITLDMLGHGQSQIGKAKADLLCTADHIASILEAEHREQTHIVGVSLGSLLAQYFTWKYPEKTLSLTVLGGYPIHKEQKELAKKQGKEMLKWVFKMLFSMDAFRKYVSTVSVLNKEDQQRFFESAQHFRRKSFRAFSGMSKLIANRDFERSFPLLILVGEKDDKDAVGVAHKWHAEDSTSNMIVIENAGHCANMDNPDIFNEVVLQFISE